VDGNARRVLSRLFAIDEPLDRGQMQRYMWELAASLVPRDGAGLFNQALMDLGADICTPRRPTCMSCPISNLCEANRRQLQDVLPVTRKRGPLPHSHVTAGVIWNDCRQVLIARRRNKGLLGGLWKFPGGVQHPEESLEGCLQRKVREELGVRIRVGKPIASIRHAYTHKRITLHAFECAHLAGEPEALRCADWCWTTCDRLKDFAFSRVDRKIVGAFTPEATQVAA
jgi:A/G-specific adenine glycosylase